MNVIVLTARTISNRIQNKPLLDIVGKPNILRIIERLRRVASLDRLIVSTTLDSEEQPLIDLLEGNKIDYCRSPKGDVLSAEIEATIQAVGDQLHRGTHYVLRATVDCPFISWELAERAFQIVRRYDSDSARIWGVPDRMIPIYGAAEFPVRFETMQRMQQAIPIDDPIREHGTADIDRHRLKYKMVYPVPPKIYNNTFYRPYRLELDTEEDLTLVRRIYELLEECPPLHHVTGLLDSTPGLVEINSGVAEKTGPLTSYNAEQKAEWKFQQVMESVEWLVDWSFLRTRNIPEGGVPAYCDRDTCYVGYIRNNHLILQDGSVLKEGIAICSCGAGRKWYR